jgi:hypothetical protein
MIGRTAGNAQKVTVLTFRAQAVLDDYGFHFEVVC